MKVKLLCNIDVVDSSKNIELKFPLVQGGKVIIDFKVTNNGIPYTKPIVVGTPNTAQIKCYVVYYDKLDFRTTIIETLVAPSYKFKGEGITPTEEALTVIVDTETIKEVLSRPNKCSIVFDIDGYFTSLFNYNVVNNPAYNIFDTLT